METLARIYKYIWLVIILLFFNFNESAVQQNVLNTQGLSKRDQEICHEAISIFSSVCVTVVDGSITFNALCKLQNKLESVEKLCEVIGSHHIGIKGLLQMQTFSFKDIMPALEMRLKECEMFQLLQSQISTLSQHCHELEFPG